MKYTALYFSASWCNPCQIYTPRLISAYDKLKSKDCEVVFVSWDKTEEEFNNYSSKMPWQSVAYNSNRDQLKEKYQVKTIPTLIITNTETGELINRCARNLVLIDEQLDKFPWPKNNLLDNIPYLIKENKNVITEELQKSNYVGLYFANQTNRHITQKLIIEYNKYRRQKKNFEIIYISYDKTYMDYLDVIHELPFMCFDFNHELEREYIANLYNVSSLPALVLLDKNLEVISYNCLDKIMKSQNIL